MFLWKCCHFASLCKTVLPKVWKNNMSKMISFRVFLSKKNLPFVSWNDANSAIAIHQNPIRDVIPSGTAPPCLLPWSPKVPITSGDSSPLKLLFTFRTTHFTSTRKVEIPNLFQKFRTFGHSISNKSALLLSMECFRTEIGFALVSNLCFALPGSSSRLFNT